MSRSTEDATAALTKTSSLCSLALKSLRAPISQTSRPTGELPALTVLRTDFISLLSLLHNRVLSLSLALKPPVTPPAVAKVLEDLNADLGRFTNCALSIDDEIHGDEMRKQMRWGAEEVIEGVQRTVDTAAEAVTAGALGKEDDKRDLLPVASLLSTIEKLKETLPKDNKAAIIRRWQADTAALEDGVRETREMIDEGDVRERKGPQRDVDDDEAETEDEGGWDELGDGFGYQELSGDELERAKTVFPLLGLVTLLHKRLLTHHLKLQQTPPLSESHVLSLFQNSTSLVSSADELASSLYTPQDVRVILTRVKEMDECVGKLKTVWDEWEAEKRLGSLKVQEDHGNDSSEHETDNWFDKCFARIDKGVKALDKRFSPNPPS
ncbi:hypothetical protein CALVIDRAFT_123316 [Calocera viscosa TUFC12733]|uniref:Uncharacterized protein n=1 Tax=Calocera viscosa (strain TUFC12733) TaxID=1330018 RepID=A0A167RNM5_CALVF|nr:hypothetical protein CALVIDRAFT_123316 [Calocera viscosa TUFC12733]